MDNRSEALLDIGKIVGTHGLRGDLKVRLYSGDPAALQATDRVILHLPSGERLTVEPVRRSLHKGQVLLRLQGFESLDLVEKMVGAQVLLPEDQLPELEEDEFYWSQLEGLQVVDRERGPIGKLESLFETAAHDTYVVVGEYGEILIPAVARYIVTVDLDARVMQVDLPVGLMPQEQ